MVQAIAGKVIADKVSSGSFDKIIKWAFILPVLIVLAVAIFFLVRYFSNKAKEAARNKDRVATAEEEAEAEIVNAGRTTTLTTTRAKSIAQSIYDNLHQKFLFFGYENDEAAAADVIDNVRGYGDWLLIAEQYIKLPDNQEKMTLKKALTRWLDSEFVQAVNQHLFELSIPIKI